MKGYALITGASKGIGRSIAALLAARGYNLLLVARAEGELALLSDTIGKSNPVSIRYLAADLSVNTEVDKVVAWVKQLNVPLSILINNAGYGLFGRFAELELAQQQNMLYLNINAVLSLTHQLLPLLQQNTSAYILNVASTAAYQAVPTLSVYAASKAFILNYSRGLRYELKDSSVSVSCLCPGPTATNFVHRAGMDALDKLAKKFNMTADIVAETGLKGMFNKKAEIIPGFVNKLSATGARLLNKALVERIGAGLYKL